MTDQMGGRQRPRRTALSVTRYVQGNAQCCTALAGRGASNGETTQNNILAERDYKNVVCHAVFAARTAIRGTTHNMNVLLTYGAAPSSVCVPPCPRRPLQCGRLHTNRLFRYLKTSGTNRGTAASKQHSVLGPALEHHVCLVTDTGFLQGGQCTPQPCPGTEVHALGLHQHHRAA